MNAFVLGAGLGTRLRPLTARRPKPLIPVGNKPLITHAFDHLLGIGVERLVVNTHWCAERYSDFFPDNQYRSVPLQFVHEAPVVLETAGGIWNARAFLRDGTFVVYNGDILSTLDLGAALQHHRASGNEVTLVLREEGNQNVTFEKSSGAVLDLRRELRADLSPNFGFTGIYFVEPAFIDRIPPGEVLSVVPVFHAMIRAGVPLGGFVAESGEWRDLGTREEYLAANAPFADSSGNVIARDASVAPEAVLRNCVVWSGAVIQADARLDGCVIAEGAVASGVHTNADIC